ncbi:flagellar basal body P-ring formation chaperone FlgA [Devosia submarina]|uniref:flagellar basal body P-ring formation chaperone FlgA n=1 Tax=Devosia submarina TaxID=1173082 RepID=UPI000D3C3D9B|nr:flagellar basal body P-ring formation chaperone FlgA [Devosia submarina]
MIIRSALALLLLSSTAFAAPVLKREITVSGPIVTVGDMFDDAGLTAENPLFRAPKPGTSGLVQLADIRSATARIGIETFDAAGLDAVRVSRAATIVDQSTLAALINQDLANRGIITSGMSADTIFTTPVTPLSAEAIPQPASVVSLRYLPGTGAFSARFAIAGIEQPLDVSGNIEMMIEAPHLTGTFPAGAILSADDIAMRPIPLRFAESTGIARLEDLVGKALKRASRDGMVLKASDVSSPLTISKNDLVTIYFRQGPMTLTVKGQAVTGATIGAPVQVINLMSKRVISATAIAAGAVEVSNDPLTLAGL